VSQKCRTLISIKKLVARRIAVEYRQAAGATLEQGGFLISAFGGKADIPFDRRNVCF
jgi:hypothetical protein